MAKFTELPPQRTLRTIYKETATMSQGKNVSLESTEDRLWIVTQPQDVVEQNSWNLLEKETDFSSLHSGKSEMPPKSHQVREGPNKNKKESPPSSSFHKVSFGYELTVLPQKAAAGTSTQSAVPAEKEINVSLPPSSKPLEAEIPLSLPVPPKNYMLPDPGMDLTEETMIGISVHNYKLIIEDKEMRVEDLEDKNYLMMMEASTNLVLENKSLDTFKDPEEDEEDADVLDPGKLDGFPKARAIVPEGSTITTATPLSDSDVIAQLDGQSEAPRIEGYC
ncbi:hypothetical protein INR49_025085 [Caranx melampygus]|nr:hypothetical protein INR49_025085 [Caranx melampygus]